MLASLLGIAYQRLENALHQNRPYLSLDDAVNALALIIQKRIFDNQIYNVLTKNCSVNDIVTGIEKHIPSLNINFVDSQIMNQLSYHVLDDKFRKHGFKSEATIEQAIKETLELLKNVNKHGTKKNII